MAKQIALDGIKRGGVNIRREDGVLKIEAHYSVMSGSETVMTRSKDITALLGSAHKTSLSDSYDAIFSKIEQAELA